MRGAGLHRQNSRPAGLLAHSATRRNGPRLLGIAAVLTGVVFGFAAGTASAARIEAEIPTRLARDSICTVVVHLPRSYPSKVTVVLQQLVGPRWLTRVKTNSSAGRTVRLRFRPRSDATGLVLRVAVLRGRHVLATSRTGKVTIGGGPLALGGVLSAGASRAPGASGDVVPTVTTQPADQTASAGQTVSFSASFAGSPAPTVQWQRAPSGGAFSDIPGATSSTLTLGYLGAGQNGSRYRAIAANSVGQAATRQAILTVEGSTLLANQGLSGSPPQGFVTSNREFQLDMQPDGNLVLYNNYSRPLWSTSTGGNPGAFVAMQGDGNLVVYSSSGQALWSSETGGSAGVPGSSLVLSANGNLSIEAPNGASVWETGALDHSLLSGETLVGSFSQTLVAPNQQFSLTMQTDGNLVLYNNHSRALWSSNTAGNPGSYLTNQPQDGNLVLYAESGTAAWSTGTGGNPGDSLQVQSDGNVVVYSSSGADIWQSNTLQSVLEPNESLLGDWTQYLTSPNREYQFVMQSDGNLVLYSHSGSPLWNSKTEGHPGARAIMQGDGNLVVYAVSGQALWSSETGGNPANDGAALDVQSDGNVVVYTTGGTAVWSTGTGGGGGGGGGSILRKTGMSLSYNPFAALYSGECTYWADHEFGAFTGGVYPNVRGNAYQWANEAQAGGWTVTGNPEPNSVAVLQPGEDDASEDGHVVWVEQVSGSKIYVSEMHAPVRGEVDHRWYTVTPNMRFILAP